MQYLQADSKEDSLAPLEASSLKTLLEESSLKNFLYEQSPKNCSEEPSPMSRHEEHYSSLNYCSSRAVPSRNKECQEMNREIGACCRHTAKYKRRKDADNRNEGKTIIGRIKRTLRKKVGMRLREELLLSICCSDIDCRDDRMISEIPALRMRSERWQG